MKGTFRKTLGIAAVFVTVGVIVMIALSPRREGFFPGLFSFGSKHAAGQSVRETAPAKIPEPFSDSLPVASKEPALDTLTVE